MEGKDGSELVERRGLAMIMEMVMLVMVYG